MEALEESRLWLHQKAENIFCSCLEGRMTMSSIPKKIAEDIRSIFKVQDKAKLVKQNISYLAFFISGTSSLIM
jgi:hypothetical protein